MFVFLFKIYYFLLTGSSDRNCMAVYKTHSNKLGFRPRSCRESDRAVCYDIGWFVNNLVNICTCNIENILLSRIVASVNKYLIKFIFYLKTASL